MQAIGLEYVMERVQSRYETDSVGGMRYGIRNSMVISVGSNIVGFQEFID